MMLDNSLDKGPTLIQFHPRVELRARLTAIHAAHVGASTAAQLAMGRDRTTASAIIFGKLQEALAARPLARHLRAETGALIGQIGVIFIESPEGLYFRMGSRGEIGMTGYIDPRRRPGRYANGRLDPMTWRRGWEWKLFAANEPQGENASGRT